MDYDSKYYIYEINDALQGFYEINWSNYYYSTWTKNAVFMDFYKYADKNRNLSNSKLKFSIWNKKDILVNLEKWNSNKVLVYNLSDIVLPDSKEINFNLNNLWENIIYTDLKIDFYPEKVEEIEPYSNKIKVEKEVFEVLDEKNVWKCSYKDYYYWNKEEKIDCSKVLAKLEWNNYKKGKLYKAKITVSFDDDKKRNNINIEDYLPGSFRVINSKFRTESSSIRDSSNSWRWSHVEARPNVMMASVSSWHWKSRVFEYYFRAEFAWSFVNPPVSVYEMYNPQNRAFGRFERVEVK